MLRCGRRSPPRRMGIYACVPRSLPPRLAPPGCAAGKGRAGMTGMTPAPHNLSRCRVGLVERSETQQLLFPANSRHCEAGQQPRQARTRPPGLPGRGNLPLPSSCLGWQDKANPPASHQTIPPGGRRRSPRRIPSGMLLAMTAITETKEGGDKPRPYTATPLIQLSRRLGSAKRNPTTPFPGEAVLSPCPRCPGSSAPPARGSRAGRSGG